MRYFGEPSAPGFKKEIHIHASWIAEHTVIEELFSPFHSFAGLRCNQGILIFVDFVTVLFQQFIQVTLQFVNAVCISNSDHEAPAVAPPRRASEVPIHFAFSCLAGFDELFYPQLLVVLIARQEQIGECTSKFFVEGLLSRCSSDDVLDDMKRIC